MSILEKGRFVGSMLATAACLLLLSASAQESMPVPQESSDHPRLPEFENRVAGIIKLHRDLEVQLGVLQPAAEASEITQYTAELARRIIGQRNAARQGDIFTPAVADEFRRMIAGVLRGPHGADVVSTLQSAEPVRIEVTPNKLYPVGVPLQTMPPSLLAALPKLPPELEYRIVGTALILRDVPANVVIDFIPNAMNQQR